MDVTFFLRVKYIINAGERDPYTMPDGSTTEYHGKHYYEQFVIKGDHFDE
jgi:hypothetical protein